MTKAPKSKYISKVLNSVILFYVFSGLSAFLNYVFYPILGRLVSVGEYGEIQFLLSMFTQLAVGFVVLNILAVVISVRAKSQSEQGEALKVLNHVSIAGILPIVVLATLILYFVRGGLNISDPFAIIALGLAVLVSIPYTVSIGKLQGNGQFLASGIVGAVGAASKLICSFLFVFVGLGVAGAIAGLGAGTLIAYVLAVLLDANRHPKQGRRLRLSREDLSLLAHIRHQALVAIVLMGILTIVSVFDSIVSRMVLDHTTAGQYAAVATVTKVLLALTTPLMWLALPHAVRRDTAKLTRYISVLIILIIAFCIGMLFTGHWLTLLLTGIDPGDWSRYILPASIAMGLCSLAFPLAAATIAGGTLRSVSAAAAVGVVFAAACFIALLTISPILAAITAQIICSAAIIIGSLVSIFRQKTTLSS